jgi:hypothetical protein
MKKVIYLLLIILLLSIALSGCSNNESNTGPAAKVAKEFLMENYSHVEEIKILDVKIEEDHAIVKAKVHYEEGAPSYKQENCKVYLEKYGNDWEVEFAL